MILKNNLKMISSTHKVWNDEVLMADSLKGRYFQQNGRNGEPSHPTTTVTLLTIIAPSYSSRISSSSSYIILVKVSTVGTALNFRLQFGHRLTRKVVFNINQVV